MTDKPLLIFPRPAPGEKLRRGRGGGRPVRGPTPEEQGRRLDPVFRRLQEAMDAKRAALQRTIAGAIPEQVLVFETIGSVADFWKAVAKIDGLEWLVDLEEEFEPDDNFQDERDPARPLQGHAYLVMSDVRALENVHALWRQRQRGEKLAWGLTKWRDAFDQLRDVRPWGVNDRVRETGILPIWRDLGGEPDTQVRFEIDLWFRRDEGTRQAAEGRLREILGGAGGRVVDSCVIQRIQYHGVLVELPKREVQAVLDAIERDNGSSPSLVADDAVMFVRPQGQMVSVQDDEESAQEGEPDALPATPLAGDPGSIVALLDGLPIENHPRLAGHVVVDDPDGWSATTPVSARRHGTSMASVIVHGDLGAGDGAPLPRPVYVRPVLQANPGNTRLPERTPQDQLLVDLIHRAVRRIVARTGDGGPVAPTVRVINLSLGDHTRFFDGKLISPWARLLDWLASEHDLLFIVSAGNHSAPLVLAGLGRAGMADEVSRCTGAQRFLDGDNANRRLRVPGESINALTVGWAHRDETVGFDPRDLLDLVGSEHLPHPGSAQGMGVRRAVKPDLLAPGGRALYRQRLGTGDPVLELAEPFRGPGVRSAAPGREGRIGHEDLIHGTSPATALVTRGAAQLNGVLEALRDEPGGDGLDDRFTAVLLKAMLVHGADWGPGLAVLQERLGIDRDNDARDVAARFMGFGHLDVARVEQCTDRRATLLGWGEIADGESQTFRVPIPGELSGVRGLRRIVLTLAWMSPIAPAHQKYRCAHLWIRPPRVGKDDNPLGVKRCQVSDKANARGTVQHEILEGDSARAFEAGRELQIPVSCRGDAGKLDTAVRYGLAVTLEVGEELGISVYQRIRDAIRPRIRPHVR